MKLGWLGWLVGLLWAAAGSEAGRGRLASESCTPLHLSESDAERFSCRILSGCDERLRPRAKEDGAVPGKPFDLRLDLLTVLNPTEAGAYQLLLNLSWEPEHGEGQSLVRGFDLSIRDEESGRRRCFLLFLPQVT